MGAQISLAGRIAVTVGEDRVDERALSGGQARTLLALLVCLRHRSVSREEMADNIWPHARPATWQTALRGAVGRVRGFLIQAGLGDADVVRASNGGYRFHPPVDVHVDVEVAAAQAERAERAFAAGQPDTARDLASRACAVLVRPLLPGLESPWLDAKRRELNEVLLLAQTTLAEARLALGEVGHAAAAARDVIALDPFRETAHRLLMRAHLESGDAAAALRAYEHCRQLLADELGADPDPETQALYQAMLRNSDRAAEPVEARGAAGGTPPGPPYRGLQTYEEADAELFFGRGGDVARLLHRLEGARFLAVLGPSGGGKSSLVRAGLIPALRRGALPQSDTWRVCILRPGAVPTKTLATELAGVDPGLDPVRLEQQLLDDPTSLPRILASTSPHGERLVVVVDQAEEVFTLCSDDGRRQAFLDALVAVATAPRGRTLLLVTLRADFYPRLAEHPRLADLVSSQQFLVAPMDEVGLAQAIEGPARAVGAVLEDGLTETILRDVARRSGPLPLLGHCLLELWERRDHGTLTLAGYYASGGVTGALAKRAETLYHGLSPDEQALMRRILMRMTASREGAEDARRRVSFSALLQSRSELPAVESLVRQLTEARLLTAGGASEEDRWVEVAHEALIRGWPRLRQWVEEDRAGLRIHRRLTEAAADWQRLDRDEGALYRGEQLAEAAAWAERHPDAPNALEAAFLSASVTLEDAQRRRHIRRLRVGAASAAAAFLVVAVVGAVALVQRDRAEEAHQVARSRQIAAESINQLGLDPRAGLALAADAVALARTDEAVAALRQALVTPQPRLAVPGGRQDFDVDPAGRFLVVGDEDGIARVWDLVDGDLLGTAGDHRGAVSITRLSPGGDLVATTDQGSARIWDPAGGTQLHRLPHDDLVSAVVWTPDGRHLLTTASMTDEVHVWDVASGQPERALQTPGPVSMLQLASDGQLALAWSTVDPELFVLDVSEDRVAHVLDGHDAAAVDARLSPDGRHAVSVGLDATARVWDVTTGEALGVHDGFADAVWTAAFAPDGRTLALGDAAGAVRVVDVASGETVVERPAHSDAVVDVAYDPDGEVFVTASVDGTAIVWDAHAAWPRQTLALDGAATLGVEARSVHFVGQGEQVVTRAATVQVWDVPQGPSRVLRGHERPVSAVALSEQGDLLASGDVDGTLRLWELASGTALQTMVVPDTSVSAAGFDPDGTHVVSANPSRAAIAAAHTPPPIWDVASGEHLRSVPVPALSDGPCPQVCQTNFAAYAPDGSTLLTGGQDGVVRLWDADTGELSEELPSTDRPLRTAALSPDGRWVAGAAWQRVPVWDADAGELVRELDVPGMSVAFSPDAEQLAVAGDDGTASLWEPATGRQRQQLRHAATVNDVAWSADGRFLVTAAGDGAHLWDVASGQRIQSFTARGGTHAVAVAPDGSVITGSAAGEVYIHRCTVCGPVDDLLEEAGERLDGAPLTPAAVRAPRAGSRAVGSAGARRRTLAGSCASRR